jgi:hypothetical protein
MDATMADAAAAAGRLLLAALRIAVLMDVVVARAQPEVQLPWHCGARETREHGERTL